MDRSVFQPVTTPFELGKSDPKGSYRIYRRGNGSAIIPGVIAVNLTCHRCGIQGGLDHSIDEQGNITPSLVCSCGFHEYGRLAGWTLGAVAKDGTLANPQTKLPDYLKQ